MNIPERDYWYSDPDESAPYWPTPEEIEDFERDVIRLHAEWGEEHPEVKSAPRGRTAGQRP